MKIGEIVVGELYAAGAGMSERQKVCVRVLDVGVNLKGRSDGVEIVRIDPDTGDEHPKTAWFGFRTYKMNGDLFCRGSVIVRPWVDHRKILDKIEAERMDREREQARLDELRGAVRSRLERLFDGETGGLCESAWDDKQVEIDLDFLVKILDRLEGK